MSQALIIYSELSSLVSFLLDGLKVSNRFWKGLMLAKPF